MGSNDIVTIFFLVAAVVIFIQLRNVLGRRTGNEKPPYDPYTRRETADARPAADKAAPVAVGRETGEAANPYASADTFTAAGSDLNIGIRSVIDADPNFNPAEFMKGARAAYEMIVMAFAEGDRNSLKNLLSREVYDGFDAAIKDREAKGERMKSTFVGISKADMLTAAVRGTEAFVTVRIVSQLISATYDKQGALIDGHPDEVAEVKDIWTFSRDTRSRDPNWKLVGTESEQ
ncbi:MAG TPA: Tim44/TimA family putative adaptor protein [Ensifer sp.]|nr:Tim44/TimA family putative adaptor protein [Ensifer sp.]